MIYKKPVACKTLDELEFGYLQIINVTRQVLVEDNEITITLKEF